MDRRMFVKGSLAGAAALALPRTAPGAPVDLSAVYAQLQKRHDEAVHRLREWIRLPGIAAEDKGISESCAQTMKLLEDAGFQKVIRIPTERHPGILATLDAGARRTAGVYFMYDVKQAEPSEWSSPPWEAALVDKPGIGRVLMGRGAVNQKGPQSAFLAALHAIRGAGKKPPVNVVLVAEGEEEIGSPHFEQIIRTPEVHSALLQCFGVFMPSAAQGLDGVVTLTLGAKGVVELELVCRGESWGRGPRRDIHSSNRARVDSPAWHLVQALNTLVTAEGEPAIDGFADKARPLSAAEKAMVAEGARRNDEAVAKKVLGVDRWVHDVTWEEALERLVSRPTVNIQGLIGGYTGPGGKTILPARAAAKLDLRLVPDMTRAEAVAALKAHLRKRGFGAIEVNVTGGYDPNSTAPDSPLIRGQVEVYRRAGVEPVMWPRSAGSWPGYVFTGPPLRLAAGHFGLGHGSGAHAPDEYYVIESASPKVSGYEGAARSFVDYLYELAAVS